MNYEQSIIYIHWHCMGQDRKSCPVCATLLARRWVQIVTEMKNNVFKTTEEIVDFISAQAHRRIRSRFLNLANTSAVVLCKKQLRFPYHFDPSNLNLNITFILVTILTYLVYLLKLLLPVNFSLQNIKIKYFRLGLSC